MFARFRNDRVVDRMSVEGREWGAYEESQTGWDGLSVDLLVLFIGNDL